MQSAFLIFRSLHNTIQPRIERTWISLRASGYSNPMFLIGTAFCLFVLILLIPADMAFFSLLLAVRWGANPEELNGQIISARELLEKKQSDSFLGFIDHALNWVSSNMSVNPSAHMLSGNTLATILIFALLFLFIKELSWSHNLMPLHPPTNTHKNVLIVFCVVMLCCITYYYSYVLFYGEYSKNIANTESEPPILQFDDSNITNQMISTPKSVQDIGEGRYYSIISYGIAMIFSTALASWGALLFFRVTMTLLFIILLLPARGFTFLIEMPITILGLKTGLLRFHRQGEDGIAEERFQTTTNPNNSNIKESTSMDNREHNIKNNGIMDSASVNDSDSRIIEEERENIINNNPLGI